MAESKKSTSSAEGDLGADQVQAAFDEANKKGFFGEAPDDTPNENYTLQGVTSDKPTPENQRGK